MTRTRRLPTASPSRPTSGVAMEAGGVAKSETGVSGDLDGRLGGGGGGVGSPFVGVLRSKGVAWVDSHHEQRVTWSSAGE